MKSMTGFGKGSAETPDVQIEIEIKSVNQRFLDLQLRMPKQLNPLEGALRQSIKQTLQRGRIELYVTLKEKNHKYETDRDPMGLAGTFHAGDRYRSQRSF